MNTKQHNDLEARALAYAATAAAYAADPAQSLYLEQVRRDADVAERWYASQPKEST